MLSPQTTEKIDELIKGPHYQVPQADKEAVLLPLFQDICVRMTTRCPEYKRFLKRLGKPVDSWRSLDEIPPVPVTMFKSFRLKAIDDDDVVRVLLSSSTTGSSPSRIFLDKPTAFRQAKALVFILKEHIGGERRPYLVLDAREEAGSGESIKARGAAIRGISSFASSTTYAMKLQPSGELQPDFDAMAEFFAEHGRGPVVIFGFTFIVWTRFLQLAQEKGLGFSAPQAVLLHSGGWKKLASQAVTKKTFNQAAADVIGCPQESVLDFYGMVEQVGTAFVDCAAGNKHAPDFSEVIIRAPYTLKPVSNNEEGIIEVMSILPTSYPGQALITEDQGVVIGVDDCPCGKKGRYFRFTKRVERTETRGCGDTFAQTRERR